MNKSNKYFVASERQTLTLRPFDDFTSAWDFAVEYPGAEVLRWRPATGFYTEAKVADMR